MSPTKAKGYSYPVTELAFEKRLVHRLAKRYIPLAAQGVIFIASV
jgi:hypothetical protein